MTMMQEMTAWIHVLVAAGGAVLSGLHLGRTRWAVLLTAGFATEAAVSAFYRVAIMLTRSTGSGMSSLGMAFALASLVGLAARVAVVAGVGGLLSELSSPSRSSV